MIADDPQETVIYARMAQLRRDCRALDKSRPCDAGLTAVDEK